MHYPRISVVTPSYNQGAYLEETILSVISQGYPDLEYIIIDGGSTDNSVEIIRKYEKHLAYWVSESDKGMYDAIQKGFERSTGEIMCWINSDDRYHPKSFFVLAEIFSRFPEVEWIQGSPSAIDEQGRIVSAFGPRKWSRYNFLLGDYKYIQQESTFWRRGLWQKAGSRIETSLKLAGDFELWLRFFDHARLYSVRTVLGAFRLRSSNQFSLERLDEYHREAEREIEKKLGLLEPEVRDNLNFILRFRRVFKRIPFARKHYRPRVNSIFNYPPLIIFDRKQQAFKMENS
jgi:glycosyltransferase involved in cell wall biosynthesis